MYTSWYDDVVTGAPTKYQYIDWKSDVIVRERRMVLYWEVEDFERRPGRPRTNWRGVVKTDLQRMGLTREEAETSAQHRQEWRQCIGDVR